MTVKADGAIGGKFLGFVAGVVVEAADLTAKEGAETGAEDKKNNIEDDCHGLIVAFFGGVVLDIYAKFIIISIRRNNEER